MYIGTYLKPPIPLVQIYLIFEHHLFKIYLDSSLSRYLSDVSPVKLSKDKKIKYFNFEIQNDNCMYWGAYKQIYYDYKKLQLCLCQVTARTSATICLLGKLAELYFGFKKNE